jgi:hypothetical protein
VEFKIWGLKSNSFKKWKLKGDFMYCVEMNNASMGRGACYLVYVSPYLRNYFSILLDSMFFISKISHLSSSRINEYLWD